MPKTKLFQLDFPCKVDVKNGKFILNTWAQERRITVEDNKTGDAFILPAVELPGTMTEETKSLGDFMLGLSDRN